MSIVAKRLDQDVLDGDPASPPKPPKGAQQPPIFGPYLLWPNWSPISATAEHLFYFWATVVKRFALSYRTIVLSVTLVYCGQTIGSIKMKRGI